MRMMYYVIKMNLPVCHYGELVEFLRFQGMLWSWLFCWHWNSFIYFVFIFDVGNSHAWSPSHISFPSKHDAKFILFLLYPSGCEDLHFQFLEEGVQRTPNFENLDTSLLLPYSYLYFIVGKTHHCKSVDSTVTGFLWVQHMCGCVIKYGLGARICHRKSVSSLGNWVRKPGIFRHANFIYCCTNFYPLDLNS